MTISTAGLKFAVLFLDSDQLEAGIARSPTFEKSVKMRVLVGNLLDVAQRPHVQEKSEVVQFVWDELADLPGGGR